MEILTQRLLNDFQRNFPLLPQPFERIADILGTSADTVIEKLRELQHKGAVSRVGPVFSPNRVGVSTLAAMAVPADRLESIAAKVSDFPQVNHNYEREHRFNLWFVVTASDSAHLDAALAEIESTTGYGIISLPLLKEYHIDLGFRMNLGGHHAIETIEQVRKTGKTHRQAEHRLACAEDLIALIQDGLPLVERPYREIAARMGLSEQAVIDQLAEMIDNGIIKRLGIVVRHHELGYRANAMVVWDVPDDEIDTLGRKLGMQDCVTLCYQRPRQLPQWPYNLFCMVHGRDREEVIECINNMADGLNMDSIPHSILFSGRRFKQRGACYRVAGN